MRGRLFAVLIALVMLVATVMPATAVTYGEPDGNAHPYVGLVVFYDADGKATHRCTGTLLSPTVFLTAGHCTYQAAGARVYFDPTVVRSKTNYPYYGGVTGTPYTYEGYDEFATFPNTGDVGVVVLDEPVYMDTYGVLADVGALDALATQRGRDGYATFTVVGYGLQSVKPALSAELTRYRGTVSLVNLRNALTDGYNLQHTGDPGQGNGGSGGTCFGDSGGPVFLGNSNVIVAVTSFGLNANCAGVGFGYRVDTAAAQNFILDFLQQ